MSPLNSACEITLETEFLERWLKKEFWKKNTIRAQFALRIGSLLLEHEVRSKVLLQTCHICVWAALQALLQVVMHGECSACSVSSDIAFEMIIEFLPLSTESSFH